MTNPRLKRLLERGQLEGWDPEHGWRVLETEGELARAHALRLARPDDIHRSMTETGVGPASPPPVGPARRVLIRIHRLWKLATHTGLDER